MVNDSNNLQNDPSDKDGESVQNPLTAPPAKVIVDEHGKPYTPKRSAYSDAKRAIKYVLERIPHGDKLMIVLTFIIAGSTVCQMVISCNNNKSTEEQMKSLLIAADRVDDAAESFSRSASGINGGVAHAVSELELQATRMEEARNSAEVSAGKQLTVLQKQFQMDRRPVITVRKTSLYGFYDPPGPARKGFPIVASLNFINSGKSPAIKMFVNKHIQFGQIAIDSIRLEPQTHKGYMPPLAPGEDSFIQVKSVRNDSVDEDGFFINPTNDKPWDGTFPILVYGAIQYRDTFDNRYCTPIVRYSGDGKNWVLPGGLGKNGKFIRAEDLCPTGTTTN